MQYQPKATLEGLDKKIPWTGGGFPPHVEIGEGWVPLVWNLIDEMNATGCTYAVAQVKEKFGSLRFYHDVIKHADTCFGADAWSECPLAQAVSNAESLSNNICEDCGGESHFVKDIKFGRWSSVCENCQ